MKRRRAIINTTGLAGISALTTKNAFTAGIEAIRFGNVIIPPEKKWVKEEHVPMFDAPSRVKASEPFIITVEVGKLVKLFLIQIRWTPY